MLFQNFISKYIINYDLFTKNIMDAINNLNNGLYDIIAFSEEMKLKGNEKKQIFSYDFITDFEDDISDIFFIIDNNEFKLSEDTVLFFSLTPLKPIFLMYKGNDNVKILKYKRYCIKKNILNNLIYTTLICNNLKYYYGEVHINK